MNPLPPLHHEGCSAELNTLAWRHDGLWAGFWIVCITAQKQAAYEQLPTLMRWDGQVWEIPGGGIRGGAVNALVSSGDGLYAGGYFFASVGGRPGSSFARWNERIVLEVDRSELPVAVRLSQNYPNPFASSTTIRFTIERPANHAQLDVYDQLGRRLSTMLDAPLTAGTHEMSFDATGLAGGVYLYRLSVDGQVATKRMVVVR